MAASTTSIVDSPALAHLSPSDRAFVVEHGIGPRRPVTIPIVHHGIEYQVSQRPNAIAVEHLLFNHRLTYAQLDQQANRLARRLRSAGVGPGQRVCILARRSIYLVVAIVAVLKSGAQYVPIDGVTVTDATLKYILGDAKPKMALVMEEYVERVEETIDMMCLEEVIEEDEKLGADDTKPEDLSSPTDGCYVIYTSGTTGTPKGVDVRHNGVTNVISGPPGNVHMRPGMRVAQLLNIAFDMGAWETLSSLYNGCTLCMRGNTSKEWAALMKSVDVVISTPSIIARHDPKDYPNIKHVIVGGEVCPQALADRWATCTQFNNCCGPTEISICNTVQPHTPDYPLSIGKPIPNTNVYVLDAFWDPSSSTPPAALPVGEVGLMYVGGIGVSRGYLNLPERTAERYMLDPFLNDGSMMFNTGDLGRWRKDGQLDHCGRKDDQVKVKGFRVELDGVGNAMRGGKKSTTDSGAEVIGANGVEGAVALLIKDELWGFVTPESVDLEKVRQETGKTQPYYAVPSRWMAMSEFPMTRNGKVDKRELRDIVLAKLEADANAKEAESRPGMTRTLTVANGGVPFSPSMPGTPMYLQLGHGSQTQDASQQPTFSLSASGTSLSASSLFTSPSSTSSSSNPSVSDFSESSTPIESEATSPSTSVSSLPPDPYAKATTAAAFEPPTTPTPTITAISTPALDAIPILQIPPHKHVVSHWNHDAAQDEQAQPQTVSVVAQ